MTFLFGCLCHISNVSRTSPSSGRVGGASASARTSSCCCFSTGPCSTCRASLPTPSWAGYLPLPSGRRKTVVPWLRWACWRHLTRSGNQRDQQWVFCFFYFGRRWLLLTAGLFMTNTLTRVLKKVSQRKKKKILQQSIEDKHRFLRYSDCLLVLVNTNTSSEV